MMRKLKVIWVWADRIAKGWRNLRAPLAAHQDDGKADYLEANPDLDNKHDG